LTHLDLRITLAATTEYISMGDAVFATL
jgi:hypothetical protein